MSRKNSEIQAVLFDRIYWDIPEAYSWLVEHNFKPIKAAHSTANYIRYRLKLPSKYRRLRTLKTHQGISLIIGFK